MPKQKSSVSGKPKGAPARAAAVSGKPPAATRAPARATPAAVSRSVENKESVPMKAAAGTKSTPAAVKKAAKPAGKTAVSKVGAVTPAASAKKAVAKKATPKKAATKKAVATPSPTHSDKQSVTEKKTLPTRDVKTKPPIENGVTMQDGRYALSSATQIELPEGYRPSSQEEYMSPQHLEFFRRKLQNWREDLVEESKQTIENLRDEVRDVGDEAERATRETENSLELRTRDRYRKLIAKINKALKRIEEGHYGYCEETDEEIGVDRLEARPIATLSLDAQERWEHRQKQMGD